MKYYLETNALYNLKKWPEELRKESFSSAFAVAEIICGMDAGEYGKRRAVLRNLELSKLFIEWTFPQEIIFDSFDAFEEYEFTERRHKPLLRLYRAALGSETYKTFVGSPEYTDEKMGFHYFKAIDDHWTRNFIDSIESYHNELKHIFIENPVTDIEFGDKTHTIDSKKKMEQFLTDDAHEMNRSATIMALVNMLNKFTKSEISEEILFSSYNSLINPYIEVYSRYSAHKMGISGPPARNDFQDLTHMIYLRNEPGRKIISNDNFYKHFAPEYTKELFSN